MKKILRDEITLYESEDVDEILAMVKEELPLRFSAYALKLLKDTNKFRQIYYYAVSKEHYAFFTLYKSRMNILAFGKIDWYMNIGTVGYPCSLSCPGYSTDDMKFFLHAVRYVKGCKLILNVTDPVDPGKLAFGETLPTCKFDCRFASLEEYMSSLRSSYRRRIKLALKRCKDAGIEKKYDNDADIYKLYLNTYEKSDYKLEKMEKGFFDRVEADKIVYIRDGKEIGFTLVKKEDKLLDFMLCGMDYSYETADLYYVMLLNIIDYAIRNGCTMIDFGQTSEQTKMKFGAYLEKRYFYVHHTNILLHNIARIGRHILEYKYSFPDYRVYKDS